MCSRIFDVQREPSTANCFQSKRGALWNDNIDICFCFSQLINTLYTQQHFENVKFNINSIWHARWLVSQYHCIVKI